MGRVVRTVTTREPEWTEYDRALMLALSVYRDSLCPKCGRPIEVCTAPEESGPQYEAVWRTCGATRYLLEKQRATYGDKPHPNRDAHLWGTTIRKG